MPRIVSFVFALALGFAVIAPAGGAKAQSSDEVAAIEQTIKSQLAAIQIDDWAAAFSHASPMIQGIFGNPETFSRMVISGYPMVWRPKSFQIGELTMSPQGPVQAIFFEDQEGRLFIADYLMQRVGDVWRINGVTIRPAPEQNV